MNNNQSQRDAAFSPAKSVIAVHDLSCFGRCALTLVIPTLAAMGVQPVPLPTAILSTHTAFSGVAVQHLDEFMPACLNHWKELGVTADAVYSGYLADAGQVDLVKEIISWQRATHDTLAVVDPAMADNGKLYSGVPRDMPKAMKRLCDEVDVITPNVTEAALMLDRPCAVGPMDNAGLFALLSGFSAENVVITSAILAGGEHANVCRARGEAGFWVCPYRRVGAAYHGTGDLFTSVLTGALLKGADVKDAVRQAGGFVRRVIEQSVACGADPRLGVQLEATLKCLMEPDEAQEEPRFVAM